MSLDREALLSERTVAVADRLRALRVLPLATAAAAAVRQIAGVLVSGGLPCIEIPFRRPDAAEAIRLACEVDELLVGAGTILTPQQADQAAAAGARFALAPVLNDRVVERCRELMLPFFPGVATPTEVDHARRLGLNVVKLFPTVTLGETALLRSLNEVFPDVRFIPTGGIGDDNLGDYLALPNVLACGGSWLFQGFDPHTSSLGPLTDRVRDTVELCHRTESD
jgi:2-dehydro-3-deoxyphosphogluconate aldolase/(4S)-4-hydroxy-2-oxoglutarate aldolase